MTIYRPARAALREVQSLTGHRTRLEEDVYHEGLSENVFRHSEWHSIRISRGDRDLAAYLLEYEAGSLLRIARAPERERATPDLDALWWLPVMREHFEPAVERLHPVHREEQSRRWHYSLVARLTALPAALRIEQGIYEDHPCLRGQQRQAMRRRENEYRHWGSMRSSLHPEWSRQDGRSLFGHSLPPDHEPRDDLHIPQILYEARGAVAATYYLWMAQLTGQRIIGSDVQHEDFLPRAERLLADMREDRGHVVDRALADAWARVLGVGSWYGWNAINE